MRRLLALPALLVPLALLASACGDDSAAAGDDLAAFCDLARQGEALTDDLATADDIRTFADLVDSARESAPAEIRDAVDTTSEWLDALVDALDGNDDNVILAFDRVQADQGLADYEAAGDEITAFSERECGIVDDSDDDGEEGGDDELDEQFEGGIVAGLADELGVTEEQARCLVTELDIGPDEEPDPAAVFDALASCDINPLDLAPEG